MADISFNEEQYGQTYSETESGLVGMVQKWGWAKDRQQAIYIMLGIAIVATGAAVYFFLSSTSTSRHIVPNIDGTYSIGQ